jgi:glyoxylase-like metal-dependent hydrolase (beta-lactamase superfamily II)
LEHELESAGCRPDHLILVLATHGDSDHVGSCVWLRQKYAAQIALHRAEVEVVQKGDPALNKKIPRNLMGALIRGILKLVMLKPSDRFTPDILLEDDDKLTGYGLNAQVLHIPGHSNGSIGVLTPGGEFFCGDLLTNLGNPAPGLGIFDQAEFEATLYRLKQLNIQKVYPGHGKPFQWEQFIKNRHPKAKILPFWSMISKRKDS